MTDTAPGPGLGDPGHRRGGWRMMRESLPPSRRWIIIGVASALGWTVGKVAVPLLAQRAVDGGIDPFDAGALLRWVLAIVGVTVFITICTAYRRYAAFAVSYRSETDIRRKLFTHLQRLHFRYHDEAQVGELMSRANTDLRQVQLLLVLIPVAGANLVMIVGVAAVLLSINAPLAVFSLVPLLPLTLAGTVFSRKLDPQTTDLQQRLAGVSNVVEETLSGIRVVKGFGAERLQRDKLATRAEGIKGRAIGIAGLRGVFNPLMELLPTLGLVVVLWFGGRLVLDGELTIGELIAFNFYIVQLIFPLRLTAFLVAQWSRASASAARVYEILAAAPEIVDGPDARPLPAGPGTVEFDGVCFGYGDDGPLVLDGLDLRIEGGESVAIVGATGSGKSTVARLVPRFYDVGDGGLRIDGVDVRDLRVTDLRRAVGIVFETTFLFHDTVRNNIALADPDASDEAIERAARLAGADFVADLPDGYDTMLGEHGFSLSGGQRQRIAIARAILADPRVLILDDATSSVDSTKEHEIRAALEEVMENRTTIVIAHRSATIALADRVVLLDGGTVVATGTHEELLANDARYREVLAAPGPGSDAAVPVVTGGGES